MPRRSSSSSGSRSSTRSASTNTRQPVRAGPPPVPHGQSHNSSVPATQQPTSSGPGLFSQMASTAAGVAVGHTVGNGLSNMLFGGGGSKEEVAAPAPPPQQQTFEERRMGGQCEASAKDFTRCMEGTNNDLNSCNYYLDQLKACQSMFQQQF
ncbi:hypothetical protein O181_041024 [Austropuccinia psidii MF-1]|uniref:CHCH domain-containing protein n=1 Tax=Austropuccinia psidii MF-1 TaxID=1389203 RepID=A0A9Q3HG37_9BASI|nr:hypothetical protein [Austropuccinia psidii MF-1]